MTEVAVLMGAMMVLMTGCVLVLGLVRGRQRRAEIRDSSVKSSEADRRLESMSDENAGLRGHMGHLEERIAVLERIATDPAERTAREIESLR